MDWWEKAQTGEIPFDVDPIINKTYALLDDLRALNYFPNNSTMKQKLTLFTVVVKWVSQEWGMILMSSAASAYPGLLGKNNSDYDYFPFPLIDENLPATKTAQFSTSFVWIVNARGKQAHMALDLLQYMAEDQYAEATLPFLTGYAPPQINVRQQLSNPVLLRGFKMLEDSNRVYVFLDNTQPVFSAATRPSGINYFLGAIGRQEMLGVLEKTRIEVLLGQVVSPVLIINELVTSGLTNVIQVVAMTTTANSSIYIKVDDADFFLYVEPLSLPKEGNYRFSAYARRRLMLDSLVVEKLYYGEGANTRYVAGAAGNIVIVVIVALLYIVCFTLCGFLWKWRNNKVIKASSPVFCFLILVGCILGYTSVILIMNRSCVAAPVVGHLAFYVVFSALFVKTYRIASIFNTDKFDVVSIRDARLMVYVAVGFFLNVVYLITWMLIDPPLPQ